MKIIIIGVGEYYKRYKSYISDDDIVAIADNDIAKQGSIVDGFTVLSVEMAIRKKYDKILILTRLFNEITSQLLSLGVDANDILYHYEVSQLTRTNNVKKRVLVISDEFKLSGAQIALERMIEILNKNGYKVTVASNGDGLLRELIWENRISIIIDSELSIKSLKDLKWTQDFDLIIVNTAVPYHLLMNRDIEIPVMWWIHECEEGYRYVLDRDLKKIDTRNLFIFCVSNTAKRAFVKRLPNINPKLLPVGIPDLCYQRETVNSKYRFVMIGEVCTLKGHDLIVDAINKLYEEEKRKCEFIFAGRKENNFTQIKKDLEKIPCVTLLGEISSAEVDKLLATADVLICASRMESLSMVVVEAMSHNVPAIISSEAGIVDYITDGDTALVFQSENVDALTEKIRWCINNKEEAAQIGYKSNSIYRTYFGMNVFEKNVLNILREIQ
ncbi:MAG: glycosyltransferase family 4 protein [Pseudobutyrivibrio sp.]|nr:glycosyltransferase family 4 protein [Pseudobutyrivibrio sp.]